MYLMLSDSIRYTFIQYHFFTYILKGSYESIWWGVFFYSKCNISPSWSAEIEPLETHEDRKMTDWSDDARYVGNHLHIMEKWFALEITSRCSARTLSWAALGTDIKILHLLFSRIIILAKRVTCKVGSSRMLLL